MSHDQESNEKLYGGKGNDVHCNDRTYESDDEWDGEEKERSVEPVCPCHKWKIFLKECENPFQDEVGKNNGKENKCYCERNRHIDAPVSYYFIDGDGSVAAIEDAETKVKEGIH